MMQNSHIEHELFLLMLHLAQRKSLAEVKQTLVEALNSLWPGVTFYESGPEPLPPSHHCVPISTTNHSFGAVAYFQESSELSTSEHALIRNAVHMAAIIMANLYQNQLREADLKTRERLRYENYFKTALDNVRLYAVTLDTNGTLLFYNRYFIEKTGWSDKELLGRNWFDVCMNGNRQHNYTREDFQHAVRTNSLPQHIETELRTKDGPARIVLWNNVLLYDQNNEVHSVTSIGSDLTAQKQAESQLREELNEKNTLIKEIHHRVKNNLNVVTSLLNLQKNEIVDIESAKRAFEESQKRIITMSLVHEDLYQSAKLSEIDMGAYIPTLVSRHREFFHDVLVIEFELNIDNVFLDITKAVPVGLIINELLTNACRHAFSPHENGKIRIELTSLDGGQCRLIFSDTGRGFPEIFDFDTPNSLGMNLIQILSQQIDGTYRFYNLIGAGFKLEFPTLHE